MAQIIRRRAVIQDNWRLLEQSPVGALPFSGDVIVRQSRRIWRAST